MRFKEIKDLKKVEKFIKQDDELWDRISEDGNKKEEFILIENPLFWWIGCFNEEEKLVGIFWMHHVNGISLQIHAHVKKEFRGEYAYKCGKGMLKYFANEMPDNYLKLIAEIPEMYQDVIHFTLKFGFKEEGINRLSYKKNKKILNQYRFGITRNEAKAWLQQH